MATKNGAKNGHKMKAKATPKAAAKPAKSAAKAKPAPKPAPKAVAKPAKKAEVAKPSKAAAPKAEPKAKAPMPQVEAKQEAPKAPVVPVQLTIEPPPDEEIILTDAEGRRYCKVKDCDQYAVVEDHCRFHYLLLWKRIQVRRKILIDGKLERYVEELTARYPDKFLEMIRKDLRTEKDFHSAIAELEIDESAIDNDYEEESSSFIDEVRGMSSESSLSEEEEF